MKMWTIFLAVIALTLVACGDDHEGENNHNQGEEETPQAEACEHMVEGPAESAVASAAQDMAPNATFEHTRVDLELVDDGNGDFVGYVNYEAAEAGEYYLFADTSTTFAILDSSGDEVAIEATNTEVMECEEVVVEHLFDLEVGTYTFVFGPGIDGAVSYVVEEAGAHEEHSE